MLDSKPELRKYSQIELLNNKLGGYINKLSSNEEPSRLNDNKI